MGCALCTGRPKDKDTNNAPPPSDDSQQVDIQELTYSQMAAATHNFSNEFLLGRESSSNFYKGKIEGTNLVVAIKRLDCSSSQGISEFLFVVNVLSNLDHCNLVKLIGHCGHADQRLLVYEYMPLGSLEDHLYDRTPDRKPLNWITRLNIALGAAKGLEYLHDKCNPPVIHGDVKSSKILLGGGFHPKLSQFGMANLCHAYDQTLVSKASDMYSFGIVLLDLITGKRVVEDLNLIILVQSSFDNERALLQIVDPDLEGHYPMGRLRLALHLTSKCISKQTEERPSIAFVVQSLQYLLT